MRSHNCGIVERDAGHGHLRMPLRIGDNERVISRVPSVKDEA